jgi:hypothetical protein
MPTRLLLLILFLYALITSGFLDSENHGLGSIISNDKLIKAGGQRERASAAQGLFLLKGGLICALREAVGETLLNH